VPFSGNFLEQRNTNYLDDNYRKHLLDSLLASVGLYSTVKFPTRISNTSISLIDNIYIKIYKHEFFVIPLINGLSDHDGQTDLCNHFYYSS
jgi:hypothetical protein